MPVEDQDQDLANEKLLKWKQTINGHGGDIFQKRLAWDGLCEETIKLSLGPVRLINVNDMPPWATTINTCIEAVTPEFFKSHQVWLAEVKSEQSYAFEDILFPFVAIARDLLHRQVGNKIHRLANSVQLDLERSLLEKLVGISGQAFQVEFSLKRMANSPWAHFGESSGGGGDRIYREFVKEMYGGEIKQSLKKYPVLAQLLGTCIGYWLDTVH